jgi:hypothetical protein
MRKANNINIIGYLFSLINRPIRCILILQLLIIFFYFMRIPCSLLRGMNYRYNYKITFTPRTLWAFIQGSPSIYHVLRVTSPHSITQRSVIQRPGSPKRTFHSHAQSQPELAAFTRFSLLLATTLAFSAGCIADSQS